MNPRIARKLEIVSVSKLWSLWFPKCDYRGEEEGVWKFWFQGSEAIVASRWLFRRIPSLNRSVKEIWNFVSADKKNSIRQITHLVIFPPIFTLIDTAASSREDRSSKIYADRRMGTALESSSKYFPPPDKARHSINTERDRHLPRKRVRMPRIREKMRLWAGTEPIRRLVKRMATHKCWEQVGPFP